MSFEYAVALTGSIATGKSTVSKIFASLGYHIIDADKIAHKILDEQSEKITAMFGKIMTADGKIDRKALGAIVFSDASKRKALESLLHPLIYDEIARLSDKEDRFAKPYLIDIPLFFEGGRYPIERSLVVYTTPEQQLERLVKRDMYSTEEALGRIDAQMPIDEKRKKATYVIDNSGTMVQLKEECMRIHKELTKDFT